MSAAADAFERWIRTSFVEINTALEELYFALPDKAAVEGVGAKEKAQLLYEGRSLVAPLVAEGNTDEGFDGAFNLLGNLGLFLGALRRHEMMNPDRQAVLPYEDCSTLAMHIGASLGVAPRFATAHLSTHNRAVDGVQKRFTSLPDEQLFIDLNTLGIFAYKRAADALMRISNIGVSHPAAQALFQDALAALADVARHNKSLFDRLDSERFFYSVRPYYKPYRIGAWVYRGANAGDFSGINEIDLLLGLCRGNDPDYAQVLVEKQLYMMPEDQARLRDCLRRRSLLAEFGDALQGSSRRDWFRQNAAAFLQVCEAHGRTAAQHHNMLFRSFIEKPSKKMDERYLKQVTASGPLLADLARSLQRLRDLRMAAPVADHPTAHAELEALRKALA